MSLYHQHPGNNILGKAFWQITRCFIDMLPSGEIMEPAGPNTALVVYPGFSLAIYVLEIP